MLERRYAVKPFLSFYFIPPRIGGEKGECLIKYCNIYGNDVAILSQNSRVDARLNYWGNWLGPSILFNLRGNKIFPPVHIKYFPWLFHSL